MTNIEIKKECKIPGTDIILEAGDKLCLINEGKNDWYFLSNFDNIRNLPDKLKKAFDYFSYHTSTVSDYGLPQYGDVLIFSKAQAIEFKIILDEFKITDISDKVKSIGYPVKNDNNNEDNWDKIQKLFDVKIPVYSLISGSGEIQLDISNYKQKNYKNKIILDETNTILISAKVYDTKRFEIPYGIIEIGKNAFKDTSRHANEFEEIYIPDSVKIIHSSAFCDLKSLKSVIGGKGLIKIESYAFYYSGLENITLYENLKEIGSQAFYNTKLKSITLPNSLKTLDWGSFEFTPLSNIEISNSLNILNSGVFGDHQCKNLIIPGNIKTIEDGALTPDNFTNENTKFIFKEGVKIIKRFKITNRVIEINLPKSITLFEIIYSNYENSVIINYNDTVEAFNKIIKIHDVWKSGSMIVNCINGKINYNLSENNVTYNIKPK